MARLVGSIVTFPIPMDPNCDAIGISTLWSGLLPQPVLSLAGGDSNWYSSSTPLLVFHGLGSSRAVSEKVVVWLLVSRVDGLDDLYRGIVAI
jgi:hypothetical protein